MLQIVVLASALAALEVSEEPQAPRTVVWIQPLSGWFGSVSVGVERAVSARLSVWADAYGVLVSTSVSFAGAPDERQTQASTDAGLSLGLRFFPAAAAPTGFWLGLHQRGGWTRVRTTALSYDALYGKATLQAGWSHVFSMGVALHGALGATAEYFQLSGDLRGSGLALSPTVWLGIGYAF